MTSLDHNMSLLILLPTLLRLVIVRHSCHICGGSREKEGEREREKAEEDEQGDKIKKNKYVMEYESV